MEHQIQAEKVVLIILLIVLHMELVQIIAIVLHLLLLLFHGFMWAARTCGYTFGKRCMVKSFMVDFEMCNAFNIKIQLHILKSTMKLFHYTTYHMAEHVTVRFDKHGRYILPWLTTSQKHVSASLILSQTLRTVKWSYPIISYIIATNQL